MMSLHVYWDNELHTHDLSCLLPQEPENTYFVLLYKCTLMVSFKTDKRCQEHFPVVAASEQQLIFWGLSLRTDKA